MEYDLSHMLIRPWLAFHSHN